MSVDALAIGDFGIPALLVRLDPRAARFATDLYGVEELLVEAAPA